MRPISCRRRSAAESRAYLSLTTLGCARASCLRWVADHAFPRFQHAGERAAASGIRGRPWPIAPPARARTSSSPSPLPAYESALRPCTPSDRQHLLKHPSTPVLASSAATGPRVVPARARVLLVGGGLRVAQIANRPSIAETDPVAARSAFSPSSRPPASAIFLPDRRTPQPSVRRSTVASRRRDPRWHSQSGTADRSVAALRSRETGAPAAVR